LSYLPFKESKTGGELGQMQKTDVDISPESRPRLASPVHCRLQYCVIPIYLAAEDNKSRENEFRQSGLPTILPRSRESWEAVKTGTNILHSDDELARLDWKRPGRPVLIHS
jgi:hypothetical protein